MNNTINIYSYIENTYSEGPGLRFTIWFQGCLKRCKGCCNEKILRIYNNNIYTVEEICGKILEAKEKYGIEGITFLGGEPILQIYGVIDIAKFCREHSLTSMLFTGYYKKEIEKIFPVESKELFSNLDIMIDGPFEIDNLDNERRWIGSKNQNIFMFTDAYSKNIFNNTFKSVEIRIDEEGLVLNGWPHKRKF